jgi:glycosyltransferase involved in cell wall biosynthesis
MAAPRIWIDFEDIFVHLDSRARPSGIQRLAFEAAREMVALAGPDRVRFLRHAQGGSGFREVGFDVVRSGFAASTDGAAAATRLLRDLPFVEPEPPGRLRRAWHAVSSRLPVKLRGALLLVLMRQWSVVTALPALGRAVVAALRPGRARREAGMAETAGKPAQMAPGDVLFALAAPWGSEHTIRATAARRELGVRYAALIYDLIPLVRPEFCVVQLTRRFGAWFAAMLPLCDIPMAISHATRRDVERFAAGHGVALRAPVRVVPIGSGFSEAAAELPAEIAAVLPPGGYVLFVSTIEARKNHTLLFRVWRLLLEQLPAERVPMLVFAGGIGWLVEDLMQQIRNSAFLDGKLAIVDSPTDAVLAGLYRGAMFSVYPSHYEGWGLPVVESLAFGTPVLAADSSSLPEAGGQLARYFRPDDPADLARAVRALIEDPADLAAWTAQVRAEFRATPWRETAARILEALDAGEAGAGEAEAGEAGAGVDAPPAPV